MEEPWTFVYIGLLADKVFIYTYYRREEPRCATKIKITNDSSKTIELEGLNLLEGYHAVISPNTSIEFESREFLYHEIPYHNLDEFIKIRKEN